MGVAEAVGALIESDEEEKVDEEKRVDAAAVEWRTTALRTGEGEGEDMVGAS